MKKNVDEVKAMLDEMAQKVFDEIIEQTCELPSRSMVETNLTIILEHIFLQGFVLYGKLVDKCTAEVLELPEGASRARITVAMEDLAKKLGSEELAQDELNRLLDEKYPLPPPPKPTVGEVEEDLPLTTKADPDILN